MIVSLYLLNRTTKVTEFIGHIKTIELAQEWYKKAIATKHAIFDTHFPLEESVLLLNESNLVPAGFHTMLDTEETIEQLDKEVEEFHVKARTMLDNYRNEIEPKVLTHDTTITGTLQ